VKHLAWAGLLASLAAGFLVDFPWGNWVGHSHWAKVAWIPYLQGPVRLSDILQNLLLFSPVGFFSFRVFPERPGRWAAFLTFPFAFAGEWTQVYSHNRFPSATDLLNNVMGAWAAAQCCVIYLRKRPVEVR
jgi:glycopeptide antibiotics resistance protein